MTDFVECEECCEQPWFQQLLRDPYESSLTMRVKFLEKRRGYVYPDGTLKKSPAFGTMFIHLTRKQPT